MKKSLFGIWMALTIVILLLYLFTGRELIVAALEGKAPSWFNTIVAAFYPRLAVEKHRFHTDFFISKADQVVIRFCLVQVALLTFAAAYTYQQSFRSRIHSFWDIHVPVRQVEWLRVLFYLGMIFFTYDWFYYINLVRPAAVFYKPLPLLRVLGIGFPSVPVTGLLCGMLMVSYIAILLRMKPVISSAIATLLFVLLQGWLFSFEKIDHTFSTLTYAALLMPCLLYEYTKAVYSGKDIQAGWPLQLIRVCIAMVYLMAGLEKLLIAGIDWIDPDSFRSYLYLHRAPAGLWVAGSTLLCTILPLLGMLFQLGFISILFFPRLKLIILLSGIAFHTGTYLLLDVGWYVNTWIFVYIFFINWPWPAQFRKPVQM
jgi:hypothetical protein